MREIPYCFDCWPGGPVKPPPCRKCGSTSNYYTSGLCSRCHPHAPGDQSVTWRANLVLAPGVFAVDSCLDCLAWGVTRTTRYLCKGCMNWRDRFPTVTACPGCGQVLAVHTDGYCRLCHRQRMMTSKHADLRIDKISYEDAVRDGHQLFLANMFHFEGTGTTPYRMKTAPPDMTLLRPVDYQQLTLFDAARDLAAGMRNGFPPPDPDLEAAFHAFVRDHATRHGWTKSKAEIVHRAIRIMLGIQDTPGAAIRRSDVQLLTRIKHSAAVVTDILAAAGMLDDDIAAPIVRWFPVFTADLPEPMRHELAVWFDIMRNGSTNPPRRRPRTDTTIGNYLRWAMPALRQWANTHQSLREISRHDVRAVLASGGTAREIMLRGLHAIFKVLKGRRLVFINPCTRLHAPRQHRTPDPVDLRQVKANLDSPEPAVALLTALLAFHAVRLWQLSELALTDVHDGRIHIGAQVIPLAEPVSQRLTAYLNYRHRCWPTSVNPYLFIHQRSWTTTRPVSNWWIGKQLGMSGQLIRQDRILDEAHATGGDLRMLCDMFGLSPSGVMPYIATVTSPDRGGTYRT